MKKLSVTLIVFYVLAFSTVKSLNIFEFSLIGIGAGLVYDQYFDSSLNSDNVYQNKIDVISGPKQVKLTRKKLLRQFTNHQKA